MINDFLFLVRWWVWILLIGLIFLPITGRIFDHFFDKGYLFSKTIGIIITSYTVWLLSSLHIAPFSRTTILIVLIAYCLLLLILNHKKSEKSNLKSSIKIFAIKEALFLLIMLFWAFIRGLQPDIHGLEKFMDFGFVNSLMRTDYMPPKDIWFANESINYYYFGHFITALLTKLTNINPAVTYNLMLATIFAFTFMLTFSLAANLANSALTNKASQQSSKQSIFYFPLSNFYPIIAGLISALLMSFGGNLQTFIYAYLLPWLKRIGYYHKELTSYWYPSATRFIGNNPPGNDRTIHEFPGYALVVSDLHAHVYSIMIALTFIALAFAILYKKSSSDSTLSNLLTIIPFSFCIAIMSMTNTWDAATYTLLLTILLFLKQRMKKAPFINGLKQVVLIIALAIPFALPFWLKLQSVSGGIHLVHSNSPLWQFLIVWGYQILFFIIFITVLVRTCSKKKIKNSIIEKFSPIDLFILGLLITALLIIITPEIVYYRDINEQFYHRANTMFKLTFQAFILFAIPIGYIVMQTITSINKKAIRWTTSIVLIGILILPMLYPLWSIKQYYGSVATQNYKSLDGLTWLKNTYPDDYTAIQFLNSVPNQPNILEADGDSYTDYERVSMATGLPTIQGWYVHEWTWRGSYDPIKIRREEVSTIYESQDIQRTRAILKKYKIKFIIIGAMERIKYPQLDEKKLSTIGKTVFSHNELHIIQID